MSFALQKQFFSPDFRIVVDVVEAQAESPGNVGTSAGSGKPDRGQPGSSSKSDLDLIARPEAGS
jgi:hypothetical protein